MAVSSQEQPGAIVWTDLTVPEAEGLREFYTQVVGWRSEGCDMGGYEDFVMIPAGASDGVAGVCHARGPNADMPAQWLIYVRVADLEASAKRCRSLGGEVLVGPRSLGASGEMIVIKDPAGAVMALLGPGKPSPDAPAPEAERS